MPPHQCPCRRATSGGFSRLRRRERRMSRQRAGNGNARRASGGGATRLKVVDFDILGVRHVVRCKQENLSFFIYFFSEFMGTSLWSTPDAALASRIPASEPCNRASSISEWRPNYNKALRTRLTRTIPAARGCARILLARYIHCVTSPLLVV